MPIRIATSPQHYGPVERCIYCLRKSYQRTNEHIIPYGIAANSLVLRKASCNRCARATHEHETFVLRKMWWSFRTKIGMPTRKKKEIPKQFEMQRSQMGRISDGNIEAVPTVKQSIDAGKFPFLYFSFKFPRCRILSGRSPQEDKAEGFFLVDTKSLESHFRHKEGMRAAPGNWVPFTRMLAKIGHAYGVARLGLGAFEHDLGAYIRKKQDGQILNWIGCRADEPALPSTVLHEISLELHEIGRHQYLVAVIRLFAFMETPIYEVVLGKLAPGFERSMIASSRYRIELEEPVILTELTLGKSAESMTREELERFINRR